MPRTPARPRLAALTAAAALTVTVGACGSGGGAAPDGPTNLTMTVWTADEKIIGTYRALADEFRAADPRLGELTVQTIPFENYVGQLTTQLQGGDSPDLGWVVESTIPALAEGGALHDIGEQLRGDPDYGFDDILPNTLTGVERADGLFGYPFANTTQPVVYNADLFAAAGVDTPLALYESGRWTWDELARVARELVASGAAAHGFVIPQFAYSNYTLLTPFLNAFGARAWPGGTECGYDDPAAIEAFTFVRSMIFTDDSYPAPGENASFPAGDVGMYLGAPSSLNELADAPFAYEVVPQPEGEVGANPFFGQAALAVFASSEDTELATELLKFLTSAEKSAQLASFIPPRRSLLTPEIVSRSNPLLTPEGAQRSLIEPLSSAEQIDFPVALPQLEAAIKPVLDGMWQPQADVAAVAAEACAVARPVLAGQ